MDIVKLLPGTESDTHTDENDGWMALHLAAQNGHMKIMKVLLERE